MNIREQHIVGGMTTDMNISKFDPTKVVYARNIRITQIEGNQGLLCVTNEKGTRQCTVTDGTNPFTFGGTIIGSAMVDEQLVVFTHSTEVTPDKIYRLDKSSTPGVDFVATALFTGNLGFDLSHPLETLPVYENENVKKVYWADGLNQLRCINIMKDYMSSTDNTVFDANPTLELLQVLVVTKRNDGGEFPAGSIQYAFTYHNQYGPETNVFETSPLYELSPKAKGVAADGRTNCSFYVQMTSTDQHFDYVRAYAIIRTSENGTPSVRLLGDFSNSAAGISFVDDGALGSSVDATSLLFVGGEPVCPSTITIKDNTLFLGNLKLTRPSIGTLYYDSTYATIAAKVAALREAGTIPLTNKAGDADSSVGSGYWFYDYTIDNNRPSTRIRRFKSKENYRLGFIAQHNTGVWSEVLWLGDYDNNILPEFVGHQTSGIWELTSASGTFTGVLNKLSAAGYKRIAPVVVYPQGSDRKVFCQGLISATVYNVEDRANNKPYSQASWFFRPISEGFGIAAIPHATLYSNKLNVYSTSGSVPTNILGGAEIEINGNPRIFLPQLKGYWADQQASDEAVMASEDMISLCGNDYFVDTSVVTLNSPDIDLDDSLQQEDFAGLNMRVVGVSYAGYPSVNIATYEDIQLTSADVTAISFETAILDYSKSKYIKAGTYFSTGTSFNYGGLSLGVNISQLLNCVIPYVLYPWHSSGDLIGKLKVNNVEYESPSLKHKVLSNIWFGRTTMLDSSTNVNTEDIKLFDSTQSSFIPLGSSTDSKVYYGDVDTVKIYKKDLLSSTNLSHVNSNYNTKEPKVLGKSAKLESAVRAPISNNKERPIHGPVILLQDTGSAPEGYHYGGIDEVLLKYGYERNAFFPVDSSDAFLKINPTVPIKYRSTKHAVIPIAVHDGVANSYIPSLYRCDALHTLAGSSAKTFWDDQTHNFDTGYVPFITEWSDTVNFNKTWTTSKENYKSTTPSIPTLYIGELYRTFDSTEMAKRFGGNSDRALLNNIWKRCGDSITIASALTAVTSGGQRLQFVEGDTYLTRYDCLKTYPYADDDVNSIVEIFSTDIETRVNLDARYDNARGMLDNTLVTPENINLVNRPGYEQTNQFFTYTTQDYTRENIDEFPSSVAITGEKVMGGDVDNWMSIPMTAVQDLDGAYGPIEYLTTFNNEVFAFQHNGFSQLLFNSRVQIPASDGQPIEITNGMKFQGTRYLSNKIGCSNKWSVVHSNSKLYWYDAGTKDIWAFGGQGLENLSTSLGVKGWVEQWFEGKWGLNNVSARAGLRTLHDETYNDIYFIGGNLSAATGYEANALVYSETLNSFISLMDYNGSEFMYNLDGKAFVINNNAIHQMWAGNYNTFFGSVKPYILRFIANAQPTMRKVFDTVQWRSDTWSVLGKYLPNETFTKMQIWNQYQKTEVTSLTNTPGKPSPLKKKFNTFRALIPRDKLGNSLTSTDMRYKGISRINGNYAVVELTHDGSDVYKTQFYDLEIGEFI